MLVVSTNHVALYYTAGPLHYITPHSITPHSSTLFTTSDYNLYYTTVQYTTVHSTLHCSALHCTLHDITRQVSWRGALVLSTTSHVVLHHNAVSTFYTTLRVALQL